MSNIVEKIKKLLALSCCEGASEAEALAAADIAQKLIDEHNITEVMLAGESKDGMRKDPSYQGYVFKGRC